jgi:ribonucleoside-diphosphate reductase alpha chain
MTRPDSLKTLTIRKRTGCGNAYITITIPEEEYKEIFGLLGKQGGCGAAYMSSLTRMITLAWNSGAPLEKIAKQLDGTKCPHEGVVNPSCPQAIANVLRETQMESEKKD